MPTPNPRLAAGPGPRQGTASATPRPPPLRPCPSSGPSAVAQLQKPPAARLERVGGVEEVPLRTAGMPVVRAHRLRRVAALVEEPANVLGVGSRSIAGLPLTKLAVLGPAESMVAAALNERRVAERASADFRDQPAPFPKRAPRRIRKARASDFRRATSRSQRVVLALLDPGLPPLPSRSRISGTRCRCCGGRGSASADHRFPQQH
jgi:hypothetical protein